MLRMVDHPRALGSPDLIVLPGTKTTVEDLEWMRRTGLAQAISSVARSDNGPMVLGICGGYQMLGLSISDPQGVETRSSGTPGLGWLRSEPSSGRTRWCAAAMAGSSWRVHLERDRAGGGLRDTSRCDRPRAR